MGKTISFIGNPGTGKTTFLVASIHRLSEIGWVKLSIKKLPKDYGLWVDSLISGGVLPPTVKDYDYPLKFNKTIKYKQSSVKLGRLGGVTFKVKDIRGEDYRRTSDKFKESVRGASAVLVTIDASKSEDMGQSLGGQIQPLIDGIRYMVETQRSIKYIGLVFTKRSFHNHPIRKIREYVHTPLGPILRYLKEEGILFRVLECDSRGPENRFKPWGVDAVYYDVLSHIGKVSGAKLDITTDPDHVWVDTRPFVPTPPQTDPEPEPPSVPPRKGPSQEHQPKEPEKPKPPVTPPVRTPPTGGGVMYLVICPSCGHKNPQGLTKCANCSGAL